MKNICEELPVVVKMCQPTTIPEEVISSALPDACKLLIGELLFYTESDGTSMVNKQNMCTDLSWNITKVDKVLKKLKKEKIIQCIDKDRYTFLYHPLFNPQYETYKEDK